MSSTDERKELISQNMTAIVLTIINNTKKSTMNDCH
jgi:hypothetical protein